MEILCYHLLLIKALVCLKKKGDPRFKLTFIDRLELVRNNGVLISESHIHKVLGSGNSCPCSFNQHTMDELAKYCGFSDWNAFLCRYPLPSSLPLHTGKVVNKVKKNMLELIYSMLLNQGK